MEPLQGVIKNYAWGDAATIRDLVGLPASDEPAAELWLGAHERGPSVLTDGRSLATAIDDDPSSTLGDDVANRFGQLPFLLKVLAVDSPLSIQAHPTESQAKAGFERENEAGIPISDPTRTYRDPHHKPELVVALTPFRALCGFRPLDKTLLFLEQIGVPSSPVTELSRFEELLRSDGLRAAVDWVLSLDEAGADRLVVELSRLIDRSDNVSASMSMVRELAARRPGDRGIAVGLLMNAVELDSGEGIFLEAGNVHAYLRGTAVEVMANSDNVVRGGLTPKHIDVAELMRVASFESIDAPVQLPAGPTHTYESPVAEFRLTRYELGDDSSVALDTTGPRLVLVTDGSATLVSQGGFGERQVLGRGDAAFVAAADGETRLRGTGLVWSAGVGG